ncbi:hypothetical protein [Aequorivita echinoideorum]|uniref:Uncharacterized protein n=1 Tax=Aequorivita echinoideorum TaxID=1549647 RepID=A0ABS5S5A4_9FLAO|nr:hypothetical protein [Aequorivita echinoideorum]MBT0608390.1 hypothetical protein [Aequorivita echinoideorum]
MSTIVNYILALILQFLSVVTPVKTEAKLHFAPNQCEEVVTTIASLPTIKNEQDLRTINYTK